MVTIALQNNAMIEHKNNSGPKSLGIKPAANPACSVLEPSVSVRP